MIVIILIAFTFGLFVCILSFSLPFYRTGNCDLVKYKSFANKLFIGYTKKELVEKLAELKPHFIKSSIMCVDFGYISNGLVDKKVAVYFVFDNDFKVIYHYKTYDLKQ